MIGNYIWSAAAACSPRRSHETRIGESWTANITSQASLDNSGLLARLLGVEWSGINLDLPYLVLMTEFLTHLDSDILWLAVPAMLLAGLVHGTFGIGLPLVATPLLALFTDVRSAVILTLLPTISVNLAILSQGPPLRSGLGPHWRVLPYVIVGALIGVSLLIVLDPRPFLLVLAASILLYLNQDRLRLLRLSWIKRRTGLAYAVFGTVAGIMAGSVNVMVPVMIILALELGMASAAMISLFNLNFLSAKFIQTSVFLAGGGVAPAALAMTLWLVPAALTGLFAGLQLRKRISEERYRGLLRGMLWLMAVILVLRYFLSDSA